MKVRLARKSQVSEEMKHRGVPPAGPHLALNG
jgi:hypothetical protein